MTQPAPGVGPTPSPGRCSCSPTAPRTSRRRRPGSGSSPTLTRRSPRRLRRLATVMSPLAAGKVDELVISTAPVILGAGKRLFAGFDRDMDLEVAKVYSSPYATHVRYTVMR